MKRSDLIAKNQCGGLPRKESDTWHKCWCEDADIIRETRPEDYEDDTSSVGSGSIDSAVFSFYEDGTSLTQRGYKLGSTVTVIVSNEAALSDEETRKKVIQEMLEMIDREAYDMVYGTKDKLRKRFKDR